MTDSRLSSSLRTLAAARLVALGIPPVEIGRWCDAWEAEAARRDLEMGQPYCEDGIRWILSQVATGTRPPSAT
jgi:hypothetical protein